MDLSIVDLSIVDLNPTANMDLSIVDLNPKENMLLLHALLSFQDNQAVVLHRAKEAGRGNLSLLMGHPRPRLVSKATLRLISIRSRKASLMAKCHEKTQLPKFKRFRRGSSPVRLNRPNRNHLNENLIHHRVHSKKVLVNR